MLTEHILTPKSSLSHLGDTADLTIKSAISQLIMPSILGYLFYVFERAGLLFNIFFVSKDNNPFIIAAMGFGNTWMLMIGLSLSWCFCYGMATLLSQAKGAGKNKLCAHVLHKGALITFFIFLLYLLSLVLFTPALKALNYDLMLISSTLSYTLWMLPSQIGSMVYTLLRNFAQGHHVFNVPVYIQVIFTVIEIIMSYFLVYVNDCGFPGLGFSRGFSELGRTVVLIHYMAKSEDFKHTFIWFDSDSLEGFWKQLKFQFYTGMVSYVEYFAFCCGEVVAAYLGVVEFDASFTYVTIMMFTIQIPISIQQPAGSFIGSAVGEGSLRKTQLWIKASNIFHFSVCVVCALAIGFLSKPLSGLFLDDPVIKEKTRQLLFMYMFVLITDVGQMHFPIILRSLGKEAGWRLGVG